MFSVSDLSLFDMYIQEVMDSLPNGSVRRPWFELGDDEKDEKLPDGTRITRLNLEIGNLDRARLPEQYRNLYLLDIIPFYIFAEVDETEEVVQVELKCGEKSTGLKTLTGHSPTDVKLLTENTDVWDEALHGPYSIINVTILVKNKENVNSITD